VKRSNGKTDGKATSQPDLNSRRTKCDTRSPQVVQPHKKFKRLFILPKVTLKKTNALKEGKNDWSWFNEIGYKISP
jgi:hypothetical protein